MGKNISRSIVLLFSVVSFLGCATLANDPNLELVPLKQEPNAGRSSDSEYDKALSNIKQDRAKKDATFERFYERDSSL